MPTNRRRISRTRQSASLTMELIDLLLTGQGRDNADVAALAAQGVAYDPFVEFDYRPDDPRLAALWQAHRRELLAEHRRRGGTGLPWGAKFDHAAPSSTATAADDAAPSQ